MLPRPSIWICLSELLLYPVTSKSTQFCPRIHMTPINNRNLRCNVHLQERDVTRHPLCVFTCKFSRFQAFHRRCHGDPCLSPLEHGRPCLFIYTDPSNSAHPQFLSFMSLLYPRPTYNYFRRFLSH
jgi:hypothetical protein